MKSTMLIVDDVGINREILKVIFRESYLILEAETGEEALQVMERCQGGIDIVLLDLMMPGISGFEFLEQKNNTDSIKKVPVVVITSSGQMEDQIKAFECGANDFILKPFVPQIVLSRVNNVMASYQRMASVELEAQKLKVKSELDEMTGLCNKTTTELAINQILKSSYNMLNALFVIDIDNFKTVNDTSGHLSGDHVIKIIADLISGLFRKTDIIGRIGGDEFVVMMVDIPSMDIVRNKANELIQIMRYKPNLTIPEYVTLSVGVASNDCKSSTYSELFQKADEALYQAKQMGKAQYKEYGVEPLNMEYDKRQAILLLSNNRNVCTIVHSLIPMEFRVIEALSIEELSTISKQDQKKIVLAYVDVSELDNNAGEYWKELEQYTWLNMDKVFAICQEGNVNQYITVLKNGIADMLTAPIDPVAFKRRTMRQLENLGHAH